MAVRYILGFDGFGEAANLAGTPVNGAGLTKHPTKPSFVGPADRPFYSVGVSGSPEHKFGQGATLRNGLVWNCIGGDGSAPPAVNAVFPIPADAFPNVAGTKTYVGFRLKRLRAPDAGDETSTATGLLFFGLSLVLDYTPSTGKIGIPNGSSSQAGPIMELLAGQEYYFEIEVTRPVAGQMIFALFVDGVELARYTSPRTIGVVTTIRFGTSATVHTFWKAAMVFGDFYIADERLGPQMLLTRQPTRTLDSNWAPSEGSDPLALLTGNNADNDAKFITSPEDNSADRYRLDFSLPEGYRAHSAELYVRGKRNAGSDRTVAASVVNVQTGEEVTPSGKVANIFSQSQYETAKLWSTGVSEDLIPANINNLAMTLSSPKV